MTETMIDLTGAERVRLVSHRGQRACTAHESVHDIIDPATLTPVLDVTDDTGTVRWMLRERPDAQGGTYRELYSSRLITSMLGDAERDVHDADGLPVIAFDGRLPDDGSCSGPEFVFAGDQILMRHYGQTLPAVTMQPDFTGRWSPTHPVPVVTFTGRDSFEMLQRPSYSSRITQYQLAHRFLDDPATIGELTRHGITVTIHDPEFIDPVSAVEKALATIDKDLASARAKVEEIFEQVEAFDPARAGFVEPGRPYLYDIERLKALAERRLDAVLVLALLKARHIDKA